MRSCVANDLFVIMLILCGEHLHESIISLRGEVWNHKTSLTPSLFIKCPYHVRKMSAHVFVCQEVDLASFYYLDFRFLNCFDNVVFYVFPFIIKYNHLHNEWFVFSVFNVRGEVVTNNTNAANELCSYMFFRNAM